MRLFVSTYPHEVRAFISIDAAEEIFYGAQLVLLTPEELNPPGIEVSIRGHYIQDDLASLVPHTRHIIATRSGHYIQGDQPELVIRSIRAVARDS
jgi:pimeloyl-ACP methyl ester carboxylesterase